MHDVKKFYVWIRVMKATYQFLVRRRDGHIAREDVSGGLQARTAKILVRYQPPSISNGNDNRIKRFWLKGQEKGRKGVQALTGAHSVAILVDCE